MYLLKDRITDQYLIEVKCSRLGDYVNYTNKEEEAKKFASYKEAKAYNDSYNLNDVITRFEK